MTARKPVPWDQVESARRGRAASAPGAPRDFGSCEGPNCTANRAASAPGAPRDFGSCEGPNCTAKIRWATTLDGRRMPVDYVADPDGQLIRVMVSRHNWRIRPLAAGETPPAGELRWTSHYATCPDAAWFRARGKGAPPVTPSKQPEQPPAGVPAAPVLLAVDGNSLGHRAWHGYQRTAMKDPDGRPIFAVYGFLVLLAGICARTRPDAVLVGFDDRETSARRTRYPDYKAGRPATDPDLRAQLADIASVLAALGVATCVAPGLEADDVTASAAFAAEAAGWRCVIATSDKDAYAHICDATTVFRLVSGLDNAILTTPQVLNDRYGVTPAQWLDYVALVGDASDNLPGVAGVGPKTAARLLAACGTLEAALADPDAVQAAVGRAAAARLAADGAREVIDRNRALMAAVRGIPVDPPACRVTVTPATVATVLRDRHLPSLVGRVTAVLCRPDPDQDPQPVSASSSRPGPRPRPGRDRLEVGVAPPLIRQQPAPVCPDCAVPAVAVLPLAVLGEAGLELAGEQVLVDQEHPSGDLLAVRVGDGWAVRRIAAWEMYLPPAARRRSHHCLRHDHACMVCGGPARLYPSGTFCAGHARPALWCCAPAGVRLLPVRCAGSDRQRRNAR